VHELRGSESASCTALRAAQALVLSYGANADLGADELHALLGRHRNPVHRLEIPHRYAFGTHARVRRRVATEYVFVGR
jgi:adenine-specific DNA-methyltransferase